MPQRRVFLLVMPDTIGREQAAQAQRAIMAVNVEITDFGKGDEKIVHRLRDNRAAKSAESLKLSPKIVSRS